MNVIGMLFAIIAAINILLIIGLFIRQLAKDSLLTPIVEFVLKMFDLQVKLMPKVYEKGIYVSIIAFAYTIMTAQLLGAVASLAVCVMCFVALNYTRRAK